MGDFPPTWAGIGGGGVILRQIKSVAKTYDIGNNTLTVENVTLLVC